jgi:hypothetical protein
MAEFIGGALTLALTIGALIAAYHAYMICIYRDIAREDAKEQADRLFREYVDGCEYRVHQTVRIGIRDEMER